MNKNSFWAKYFKSSEEVVSMFLGLIIVIVVVGLVYNFFQRRRGNVDLAGVTDQKQNDVVIPTGTIMLTTTPQVSIKPTNTVVPTSVVTISPTIAPTATSTPQKGESGTYVVKANDSLWKIAVVNYGSGYNWVDIARENKLTRPGVLHVGQKLILPSVAKKEVVAAKPTATVEKIESNTYTVVKGDSLWKIAVRKYADGFQWSKIWEANKSVIRNPSKLNIGTKLTLPALK